MTDVFLWKHVAPDANTISMLPTEALLTLYTHKEGGREGVWREGESVGCGGRGEGGRRKRLNLTNSLQTHTHLDHETFIDITTTDTVHHIITEYLVTTGQLQLLPLLLFSRGRGHRVDLNSFLLHMMLSSYTHHKQYLTETLWPLFYIPTTTLPADCLLLR